MIYLSRFKLSAIIFLAFSSGVAVSQNAHIVVQASEKAVFLCWTRTNEQEVFHVYRRSQNDTLKRLNASPIVPLNHRHDIVEVLGQDCDSYLQRFGVSYPEQIVDVLSRNKPVEAFACALDPHIAIIRGSGYVDTAVTKGKMYTYSVTAVRNGTEQVLIDSIRVETISHPPLAPINASAVGGNRFVDLYWKEPPERYSGAEVFRSDDRDKGYRELTATPIFVSAGVSRSGRMIPGFRDTTGIVPLRTYWYKLASRDVFGNVTYSPAFKAIPFDSTPPSPPMISNILVDTTKRTVTVSWQQTDTIDVAGFYVYSSRELIRRGLRENQTPLQAKIRSHTFFLRAESGIMWYRVGAIDSYGNESYSRAKPIRLRK